MFVFTLLLIFTFTAVGNVVSEIYKKGDKAVLSPGSVSGPITSVMWKHGADIAVEWYGQELDIYQDFKGRCELNTATGALTISNLSLKDSGSYTAEINNIIMKTTGIKVITAVPKPTISTHCNPEETQCTLTCDASITKDTGPVIYSWEIGDRHIPESPSNWIDITKNDTESLGKPISCQLENPVGSECSDDIMSPFTNGTSVGVNTAVVLPVVSIYLLIVLIVFVAVLAGFLIWCKYKPQFGNAGSVKQQRQQEQTAETKKLISQNTNGAATSPENQTVPNHHQQGPEPPDTNKGAEKHKSTLKIENEAGPDQTPADSTGTSSETSAEAPNAEEPPDHHHQQEDETREE